MYRSFTALALLLALALTACGDDDEVEVATERQEVPEVTPTALAALPEGVEQAALAIVDGGFDVEELVLQAQEPTVLEIVNHDEEGYVLQIGDLVTPTPIEPSAVTEVKFTTPKPAIYTARISPIGSSEVVDEIRVIVQEAGATSP
jgi:hypothetical protein